jgi:dCMP deaminase
MRDDKELQRVNIEQLLSDRPKKEIYYLSIAYVVAQASFDPSSKCGSVIVSKDGRILSTGYNGPLKHSKDEEIPLTRPEKYCHFIHGEENAIIAYSGSYQDIVDSTIYITGRPCHRCLRMIIQKGITRIVFSQNNTKVIDQADIDAQIIMLRHHPEIKLVEIMNNVDIQSLLIKTNNYIEAKKNVKPNY